MFENIYAKEANVLVVKKNKFVTAMCSPVRLLFKQSKIRKERINIIENQ